MPRGRSGGGGGSSPSFTWDISDVAIDYVKSSIKDMPGNPGQEVLVQDLEFDGYMWIVVEFNGDEIDISCTYDLKIRSNHPEAIEQIIKKAYDKYSELGNRIDGAGNSANKFSVVGGLDYLTGILRQDAYDYAASSL